MSVRTSPASPSRFDSALVWGMDCSASGALGFETLDAAPAAGFRWLHLNLADQRARHWVEQAALPSAVRAALLSSDTHQRGFVDGDVMCCVFHDLEREYDGRQNGRVGAVRVALMPDGIITIRAHPLGFADIARRRLAAGIRIIGPADALDLLGSAIVAHLEGMMGGLTVAVQEVEDAVLEGRATNDRSGLLGLRRRVGQLRRILDGMQRVVRRLEGEGEDLPERLGPERLGAALARLAQQVQGLDGDAISLQAQLLLVRDEMELQANHRINQNLMLLSVMTALMLPATLVTGVFGMNTGGMWLTGPAGTLGAAAVAGLLALLTYLFLKRRGFFR